jgi:GNAT superfamily N-acetyltransferase
MEGSTTDCMAVDTFQTRQTDIGAVDVAQLHALSMAVGWPHRADDWDFLRTAGHGIAARDDIGRVLGSAMWFPHGSAFATVGMVITSPRLQALGTGQWLMKSVLSACAGRMLRLNATRAARRLYQSLDFVPEKTVFQCQGEAHAEPELTLLLQGATVRRLDASDLAAAVRLDAEAFGVVRDGLIASLFQGSVGYGLFRDDRLEAFALCRRFGRGHVVGPVVAGNDAEAIAVVQLATDRMLKIMKRRRSTCSATRAAGKSCSTNIPASVRPHRRKSPISSRSCPRPRPATSPAPW